MAVNSSQDLETRRCLAFAMNNLSANEDNHAAISKMGMLISLVSLLAENDKDTH